VANAIVWKKVFDRYRSVVMGARLVRIRGKLQSQNGVIHVVADEIEDMTSLLGLLQRETSRFAACERADEALRPTADHRSKKPGIALPDHFPPGPVGQGELIDTASVMPKGRNFH
jgi:hypothetical protein